jgi:uncharacterized membrane protein YebE (DUF533 family)
VDLWTGFIWLRRGTGAGPNLVNIVTILRVTKEARNMDGCVKEKEKRRIEGQIEQKYKGKHSEETFLS